MVKITVLGSYNQDITMITPKIPRPKETISGATTHLNSGGKGYNQANAAHKLGAEVLLIAKVGRDPFGEAVVRSLNTEGMSTEGILLDDHYRTGIATILVDEQSRQNMIVVAPGANHHITIEEINQLEKKIESSDICIFQFENNLDAILYMMKIAHQARSTIILNPAPMREPFPQDIWKYVDILVMNEIETAAISGIVVDSKDTALQAAKYIARGRNLITIVTLGSQGVVAWDGKSEYYHPSYKVEPVDTTGAGDAFIGAFATQLGTTKSIIESLKFASAAAAINITRIGASSGNPTKKEVDIFLKENS